MTTEKKSRRPVDSAFKQQRLRACQPNLTPKTVLPVFLIVGILFAPIGGLLLWASDTVAELIVDYTECDKAGLEFVPVPTESFTSNFPGSAGDDASTPSPEYRSIQAVGSGNNVTWPTMRCTVKFHIPVKMKRPVFVFYRLTNFHQNHRQWIKSMDMRQLAGERRSVEELKAGGCDRLAVVEENNVTYPIYPCGLMANSMFNDSFGLAFKPFDATTNDNKTYLLIDKGIAWDGDASKYAKYSYELSEIRPPPNWRNYPNGYSEASPPINVAEDEHFQVWMRTSGLPNFRKIYAKNEQDDLPVGTYTIDIDMNYNVTSFTGTKSIVISTVSFMGGRNPFLGIAYVVVGVLCVVLGFLFVARHLYKPRRLGDHTFVAWDNNHRLAKTISSNSSNHRHDFEESEGEAFPPSATTTGASARY
ncbi:hypothetical protein BX616_009525 [Lobosporangium transversale]|uniref:Ligand-effect modulator 3 family n=1 Tax=Lobosporangium transversale TaxID=64571 RepID=A0A1Y2GUR8_9FUNG|nr:ligand-effect modulator 3 family [Lobosporangium transversale]KAF9913817.1 hypothetical protein BX616_009525 [Lobosporangium transversale]ORZ19171.1 ligand-effect modulator 3 family [Lobosporangium transversale]|eukprot:XP_021882339.1 ligand-effect modulator 3 family [Lobosporangium transversale]